MSYPPAPSGPQPLNTKLLWLFGFLLLIAIPALPIYLWRKGRLSAPVGIGLAIIWIAGYLTVGALLPEEPEKDHKVSSAKSTSKPTPVETKPTVEATKEPAKATTPTPVATTPVATKKPDPCAGIGKNVLKNKKHVFSCQFGAEWPLKPDNGLVGCRDKPGTNVQVLTFIDPDGKEWALNGIAKSSGYPAIDPIWRDDPDLDGAKINISPLVDRAEAAC